MLLRIVGCHVEQLQLAGRQVSQQLVIANPNRADRRTEMAGVMKNQSRRVATNASCIAVIEYVAQTSPIDASRERCLTASQIM